MDNAISRVSVCNPRSRIALNVKTRGHHENLVMNFNRSPFCHGCIKFRVCKTEKRGVREREGGERAQWSRLNYV